MKSFPLTPGEIALAESWADQLCDLMEEVHVLVGMGLLEVEAWQDGSTRYTITAKGREAL